jgi:hypothetical protein
MNDQADIPVRDLVTFLAKYQSEITKLRVYPGVEDLEICLNLYWEADTVCYPIELPPSLTLLAGQSGVAIAVNVFATSSSVE